MLVLKGIENTIRVPVVAQPLVNGKPQDVRFWVTYKRKTHTENQEVMRGLQDRAAALENDDFDELPGMNDLELLAEYVVSWELKDAEGAEVPIESLAEVCEYQEYRTALVTGLLESMVGKRVLAKN